MKTLFLSLLATLVIAPAIGQTIYVSPSGNDNAAGTSSAPVASLRKACNIARELRKSTSKQPITISIAEGSYSMRSPLTLTPEDAGTEQSPLIIKGQGMGKTILSGGIELPPFIKVNDNLWKADLSDIMLTGGKIEQLFINSNRAVRARTPNADSYFIPGPIRETKIDSIPERGATRTGFACQEVKMPSAAVDALNHLYSRSFSQLKVSFYHAWDMTRRYVLSYSPQDSTIFVGGDPMKSWNPIGRCAQIMFEDDRSFLDAPGEWFYDETELTLYYIPRKGEEIENSRAVIPGPRQLLKIEGTADQRVSDIQFENLSFQYTNSIMSWKGDEPQQAASSTDATVMADYAQRIKFTNCEISHTGNNAIWLRNGCSYCNISRCYLHDLGIGALKIGTQAIPADEARDLTNHITADNNIFRDGSLVFPTGVGVTLFSSADNTISHNEISKFYYSGVSVGWVWGYAHSPSKRNHIIYNHIHHIGWGLLSDMGGVYTLGKSEGSEVSNNVIHHIYSFDYGGWGLYTDEGSTGIHMENNLVYQCKSSGFHQHYGENNFIRNNIFVNQLVNQLEATRIEEHNSFTFSNNVIYYTQGNMYGKQWDQVHAIVDKNCYWNPSKPVSFNGKTMEEWRNAHKKDLKSIIADPKFYDISKCDFRMKNKAALKKIGFVPFDYTKAGVYGDTDWLKLSEFDPAYASRYDELVNAYEKGAGR